jgi:L-alanine-DL-glutamate epimerase-like enolase superfamily enzyme
VVKSFLTMPTAHNWSRNIGEILVGQDPGRDRRAVAEDVRRHVLAGRRGLGIHALSAVDIALHDLAGKQLGLPAYKLMGGARRKSFGPIARSIPAWRMAARSAS